MFQGQCIASDQLSDYSCQCYPGYSGSRCNLLTSVSFQEPEARLALKAPSFRQRLNVTFQMITKLDRGVLVYHGKDAHLAVELFEGRIRTSYYLNNHPPSLVFSPVAGEPIWLQLIFCTIFNIPIFSPVSDGLPHIVQLWILGKNLTMKIDDHEPATVINDGPNEFLDSDGETRLYIGGIPKHSQDRLQKLYHFKDTSSFSGIQDKITFEDVKKR